MTAQTDSAPTFSARTLAIPALLGTAVLWSYWTTLAKVALRWSEDPQYSHGYLVPAFALYLLWVNRHRLDARALNVNGLGLGVLGLAMALRLAGTHFHFEYFDQISLLPACAGLFLLVGGWRAFFWSLPAVCFLAFMIPLPHSISMALSAPMQSFATTVSTFLLQAIGKPALAEGNVILLSDMEFGIVEACSGLRMLVVFFALSTGVAMLIGKPFWEKAVLAASAVPIALASNVLRVAGTVLYCESVGPDLLGMSFHDLAGYLMPFVGMAILGIEMWILKHLLIDRPSETPIVSQVTMHRVEVPTIALYDGGVQPRREKSPPLAV